jgi:hypothetical protein
MEFHVDLDRNIATVYDLMYSVARHHGGTIETDKVRVFQKVSDEEFHFLEDFTQKLSVIEACDVFYYDFDPVSGSLLVIPPEK